MENATLVDIVKEQNPNGGLPSEVWNRFIKANGSKIGRKAIAHDAMIYNALVKWYGSGRSLYDLKDEDAARYVEFLAKNTSANSVWRVSLPTLTEIWSQSLPLCGNPWVKFKWDSMRESVVPEKPLATNVNDQTGLEEFAEKFFAAEASSGKKIEQNAIGFVRHLMKHMGVKTIGDVTRKVAYEYAVKLRDDPKCRVVRGGVDRISKLASMWKTLLPNSENPFDGVTYADAMRVAKYNAILETKTELSPTECVRAMPPVLWNQYIERRPKISLNRSRTMKAIFFRFWDKTGLDSPIQVTTEVASKYAEEVIKNKSTGLDDIRDLRSIWDFLMPNIINPWEKVLQPMRKKSGRKPQFAPVTKPTEESSNQVDKAEETSEVKTEDSVHEETIVESNEPTVEPEHEPVVVSDYDKAYTFAELFDNWKNAERKRAYDPKTIEQYQRVFSYFMDYAKMRGVSTVSKDTVTLDMAKDFQRVMMKRVKIIRNIIGPLKLIWNVNFGLNNPWRTLMSGMQVIEVMGEPVDEPPKVGFWKRLLRFFGIGKPLTLEA